MTAHGGFPRSDLIPIAHGRGVVAVLREVFAEPSIFIGDGILGTADAG